MTGTRRDVVVVCPQERDRREVAAANVGARYRVRFVGPDLDERESSDVAAVVEECARAPVDGVVGTKDRSALVAALVAARRGLPGPRPETLVALQHKPTARARQREVVPGATPRFALLDDGPPPFGPPFFVKPVVGRLSQGARPIGDVAQLALLERDHAYATAYAELAELAALAGFPRERFHGLLAEELLAGDEATLEGFVHGGRATVVGITDSLKYPGTNSFEAFAYPSALPPERQDELASVATRLLPALGFDGGFFNVEFLVPADGPARIVEVNGRMASQFAPLVRALHGRSTYEALLALACGQDPRWRAAAPAGAAVSYVLRVFEDALVAAAPDPDEGLEVLVRPGARLSDQRAANDVASYRLAILYEAAETREEALRRARTRAAALDFRLEPVGAR